MAACSLEGSLDARGTGLREPIFMLFSMTGLFRKTARENRTWEEESHSA